MKVVISQKWCKIDTLLRQNISRQCITVSDDVKGLNNVEGHLAVAGLFKCKSSNIYAAIYKISTGTRVARSLCDN